MEKFEFENGKELTANSLASSGKNTIIFYEKEMISAATCGYELADNQIAKHVNVTLGFDTVQSTPEMTLDMDDIGSGYIENNGGNEDEE